MSQLTLLLVSYIVISLFFVHQQASVLNLIDVLSGIKDSKMREKIKILKSQINWDIYMSVVWPLLLLRSLYNVIKRKLKENNT